MTRIEDFLFLSNIEQSQAESLIAKYPNLSFETVKEFTDFFQKQGIKLSKAKNKNPVKDDTQILLDRLKEFKSSTDYDYVKKYIIREKVIEESIRTGNIELGKNEFDSLVKEQLDPFFGFIVRKILTGSENGVLPSENLKAIFDEQNRNQSEFIDVTAEVNRDENGKIISFKNYLKNKGVIKFDMVSDRFRPNNFSYVINKNFTEIPEASDAERYVLEKAEEWGSDINISTDEAVFLEKLKKLINEDSTSLPALEAKVEKLQLQLNEAEEMQQTMSDANDNLVEAIEQLSSDYNTKVNENEAKDTQIAILNETIDETLTQLGNSVSNQLEDVSQAFDDISAKLEEQSSKRSEELKQIQEQAAAQAAAQLDAFKQSIGQIASAIASGSSASSGGGSQTGGSSTSGTGGSNTGGGVNTKQGNTLTDTQAKIAKMSGILKQDIQFRTKISDSDGNALGMFEEFRGVINDLKWTLKVKTPLVNIDLDSPTGKVKPSPSALADVAKYLILPAGLFVTRELKTLLNSYAYDNLRDKVISYMQSDKPTKENIDALWNVFIKQASNKNLKLVPKLYDSQNIWDGDYIRNVLGTVPLEYQNIGNPDSLTFEQEKKAKSAIISALGKASRITGRDGIVDQGAAQSILQNVASSLNISLTVPGTPGTFKDITTLSNEITTAINQVPSEDDGVLVTIFADLRSSEFKGLITETITSRTPPKPGNTTPGCDRAEANRKIEDFLKRPIVVDKDSNRGEVFKTIWRVTGKLENFLKFAFDNGGLGIQSIIQVNLFVVGGIFGNSQSPFPKDTYNEAISLFLSKYLSQLSLQEVCDLSFALQDLIEKFSTGGGTGQRGGGAPANKFPL